MKKILLALIAVLFIGACKKDVTTVNVDPKRPLNVSSASLFTNAQRRLVNTVTSSNVNLNIFRLIEQQWQETTYIDESQYDLQTRTIPDNLWNAFYRDVLKNFKESRTIAATEGKSAVDLKNQLAITDIMEVYSWYYILTTFGDVPYSEALNIDNAFPKYDDGLTAFKDLLKRLDADIAALNPASASLGSADAIYDGDPQSWKKLANSLKLKVALTIADADNATAKTAAEAAVASGVFAYSVGGANVDNAKYPYTTITPNTNPIWVDLVQSGRLDFVANNTITTQMNTLNDPRRPFFFTLDADGVYSGGNPGESSPYANFSAPAVPITKPDFPGSLIDVAEVQFLLAEAAERGYSVGGTAGVFYSNAVTASILDWGGTLASATIYLAQPSVAYATATGTWRKKIGTQKWLALYNRGLDAWIENRRLDYPQLPEAADAQTDFPVRFTYPVKEQNVNNVNRAAAATKIGGDNVTTKLFWDKF
ncbi:SusD/RagB family nutrient-binding outer membrane lipoprotein [Pedobacter borealis]|uniref:SusD/RagB family nutrient-binding outer membrane lipoprotein n=1 Tax=Pedobacter borealis TaxID=475254 RepID=UPI000493A3F1|nr:SusD/RagB family nutrient-binding outer membrane lipoprotein [Pedobacter borealis]